MGVPANSRRYEVVPKIVLCGNITVQTYPEVIYYITRPYVDPEDAETGLYLCLGIGVYL